MNWVHATSLRLLKDVRERGALGELSKMEATARIAAEAAQHASEELAIAQRHCARAETELCQRLGSLNNLSVTALDHAQLRIERLSAEVAIKHEILDDARSIQEEAETAASEARTHWISCLAARHKWQQIEDDARRAVDIQSQAAGEMEAEDEVLPGDGRGLLAQVSGNPI
ncbi:hypothetical protein REMIM1_PE00268 (plasmid) [Rhizobium etli bv. mimosae str. Mim1]|nr:hypothetical protein REMIM1_PE00268 [Rhizobium etli bv. mimosae str. Mim1]